MHSTIVEKKYCVSCCFRRVNCIFCAHIINCIILTFNFSVLQLCSNYRKNILIDLKFSPALREDNLPMFSKNKEDVLPQNCASLLLFWYLKGKRPVSLIGFSLGARVIYYCLQELANDKGMIIFLQIINYHLIGVRLTAIFACTDLPTIIVDSV